MTQSKKSRLAIICLLVIGGFVLSFGIDWGLPSNSGPMKQYLAASLSGAGIDHLAGGWEDDPNRAADVAMHPTTNRSEPVVLLGNPREFTEEQIPNSPFFANLLKQRAELAKNNAAAPQVAANQQQIARYIDQYNESHIFEFHKTETADSVSRARILRRYRLYSDQPDEMNTLRSLAQMHPAENDFDPRMYQYGGLWIYPVGALIKGAGMIDLMTVTSDRERYLDHPEEFARFYIVMRAYCVFWGLVGMLVVFHLVRRAAGGLVLPTVGAICFVGLPVVLSLSHEAKPHLPGIVLLLLAVAAASKYVETGKIKWMIWTSIACGAAAGMVLSAITGLLIIPIMSILRKDGAGAFIRNLIVGVVIAVIVYFATNPYVAMHLAKSDQRQVLVSNYENTRAMYQRGPVGESLINAVRLIAIGAGGPIAILGIAGLIVLLTIKPKTRPAEENANDDEATAPAAGSHGIGWLLATVGIIAAVQFAIFAANKPPEHARFAAMTDVALMIAAVVAISRISQRAAIRAVAGVALIAIVAAFGASYFLAFSRSAGENSTRFQSAQKLETILKDYPKDKRPTLGILQEPAPYCMPPVDLYHWKIILLPKGYDPASKAIAVDAVVTPVETFSVFDPTIAPITWADTRFDVRR